MVAHGCTCCGNDSFQDVIRLKFKDHSSIADHASRLKAISLSQKHNVYIDIICIYVYLYTYSAVYVYIFIYIYLVMN